MNCPSCGTANPEGNKFCAECGTALAQSCTACGATSPPGTKFCGQCGAPLAAQPSEAATVPGVAKAAESALAERRLVSVLFADLVGFTTLSESRDAEDTRELLSRYFDHGADG